MIVAANLIRNPYRGAGMGSVSSGLGWDEILLAHPENPCAPGLTYVNGSCFRQIGADGNPVAGPESNNVIAERVLGAGVNCERELVTVGPYAYAQNVCRDAAGNVIAGADVVAEHDFVQQSLTASPSKPFVYNTVPPPALPPTTNGSGNKAAATQQSTQAPKTTPPFEAPLKLLKEVAEDPGGNWMLIAAVGVGFYFLVKGNK